MDEIIDALFHGHLGFKKNVVSAHALNFYFVSDSSQTSVPTFRPSTASRKIPGLYMSNTTIGILLSMQRLNAVESITCSRLLSASVKVIRSKRFAVESLFGSRS